MTRLAVLLLIPSVACTHPGESVEEVTASTLGTAASFLVLGAETVTSTGPTVIDGDVGVSPGSEITGFPPGVINGEPHQADGPATQAQSDLVAAWNGLNNEPCELTLDDRELGGLVLTPGVYCFTSPSATLTGQLTLDAEGDAAARFVFQIDSTLVTASNSSIIMVNGGSDCNVFWAVGSSATLGTGTTFVGNILASTSITLTTGANVSGRLLAHTGAVTLDSNAISLDCQAAPPVGADAGIAVDGSDISVDAGVEEPPPPPPPPSVCGNGIVELGEQCDDGNDNNIDGCTNTCYITT